MCVCILNAFCNFFVVQEIGVQLSEATEILRLVHEYMTEIKQASTENVTVGLEVRLGGTSAFDLLKKEETAKTIVTFSRHMDEMLEGGVPVGKITEICGSPGTGKTQLWLEILQTGESINSHLI